MKKLYLLILSFLVIQIFSGCSNPVSNSLTEPLPLEKTDRINTSLLEFYVWRYVHNGMNPGVEKAYIDIYQGTTLVYSTGVTSTDGKLSIPVSSLPTGNYTVFAYTMIGDYYNFYGYRSFNHSGSSNLISIQVFNA